MDKKEEFKSVVDLAIDREGIDDLMGWLEETDFYTAPASTRYHGAHEGGLVEHSLAVYDRLVGLVNFYSNEDSDPIYNESLAIVSLFHDLCKVNCYKPDTRNVKDDKGVWHKVPCYKYEEQFPFGGHGSKSVYLVQHFMHLDPEEAAAINCHMGQFDATTYSNPSPVYSQNKLAWLLHVADEAATFIDGR